MSDFSSKLQDREWVADLIRRTEEAQAANRRLLDVLYAEQEREPQGSPHWTAEYLEVDDVIWWRDGWRVVTHSGKCHADGCWYLTFKDGTDLHTEPFHRFHVRRTPTGCALRCDDGFHWAPCPQAETIAEASGW